MSDQRGVALITVLLVMALAATIAAGLAADQQRDIRRTTLLLHRQQARHYLSGAEIWAIQRLYQDRRDSRTDHADEDWAAELPPLPVGGGWVKGSLSDLQGRFNLNNLLTEQGEIAPAQLELLQRLLDRLGLDPDLTATIADWLDPDPEPRFPGGAEDSLYRNLNPPYLGANRPFASTTELRLLSGVDGELWRTLEPQVSALPEPTAINVNTASEPLLGALDPRLDEAQVRRLIQERAARPFTDGGAFIAATGLEDFALPEDALSGTSDYFLLRAEARVGEAQVRLDSLLYRRASGLTRSLQRSEGGAL